MKSSLQDLTDKVKSDFKSQLLALSFIVGRKSLFTSFKLIYTQVQHNMNMKHPMKTTKKVLCYSARSDNKTAGLRRIKNVQEI